MTWKHLEEPSAHPLLSFQHHSFLLLPPHLLSLPSPRSLRVSPLLLSSLMYWSTVWGWGSEPSAYSSIVNYKAQWGNTESSENTRIRDGLWDLSHRGDRPWPYIQAASPVYQGWGKLHLCKSSSCSKAPSLWKHWNIAFLLKDLFSPRLTCANKVR